MVIYIYLTNGCGWCYGKIYFIRIIQNLMKISLLVNISSDELFYYYSRIYVISN